MDSSGYSGDPACGRSPVQFRVCPKNRVVHPSEEACVPSRGKAEGAFYRRVVSLERRPRLEFSLGFLHVLRRHI